MSSQDETAAAALYEGLARYQWWSRRLRRAPDGEALEMHKRLRAPAPGTAGPPAGQHLHDWLWEQAAPGPEPRLLEVGCGFGASLLHFARTRRGHFVGIGNSPYQIARARAQARALPLLGHCEFWLQSHDQPVGAAFDRILAVETLIHAQDLARTLANLARALRPGGCLLAVEDLAADASAQQSAPAQALCRAWAATRLGTLSDWQQAAAAAGLHLQVLHDLSAQVDPREEPVLQRAERRLRRLAQWLPGRRARGVVAAFLGGIALERLYHAGGARYLCLRLTQARPA